MENWKRAMIAGSVGGATLLLLKGKRPAAVLVGGVGLAVLASEYPNQFAKIREELPSYVRQGTKFLDLVKWISNYDGQFKGMIPLRMALAESRNAVAVWITEQIGVASVLQTARSLGIRTPLRPYATTALGASEVNLLELANAYRTIASGILTQPYVIRRIVG